MNNLTFAQEKFNITIDRIRYFIRYAFKNVFNFVNSTSIINYKNLTIVKIY